MTPSPIPPIHVRVFGSVAVLRAGGESGGPLLTAPRPLAILLYLVLARPRGMHARETLVALLWPEADAAAGHQALRNALHRIRQALGDGVISTSGGLVGIEPGALVCDALELENAATRAPTVDPQAWVGEPFAGFHVSDAPELERWMDDERVRLRTLLLGLALARAEAYRESGELEPAIGAARRATAAAPFDEVALRRLLELLHAAGARAEAVRLYEAFAERFDEELGAEPSAATQALARLLREPPSAEAVQAAEDRARGALPEPSVAASPRVVKAAPAVTVVSAPRRPRWRALGVGVAAVLTLALAGSVWSAGRLRSTDVAETDATALLAPLPARYRQDTASFHRYLRGQAQLVGDKAGARQTFRSLADDQPLYAPAWAGLGEALYMSAFDEIAPVDAMPRARAAAERALALDSTLAQGQRVLIAYDMWGRWDLDAAKARLDAALALHPRDPELNNLLGIWRRWRGELRDARTAKQVALSIDPLSPRYARQVAWNLYLEHRCDEAVVMYRRLLPEQRRNGDARIGLYRSLICLGRRDEAVEVLRESLLEGGDSALAKQLEPPLTPGQREAGLAAVFRARLDREMRARRNGWRPPEEIMLQYAELQNADSTLAWLDSMYVDRSMLIYIVPFDPLNDFLRDDPRFAAFLRKLPWVDAATKG